MERRLSPPPDARRFTAGGAYWRQRGALARSRERILALFHAVDEPGNDMVLYQWVQLLALALDYAPDLVIELGRGHGNSTCMFTEAINQLGPQGRSVVSLCLSDAWETRTVPRIAPVVPPGWLAPLDVRRGDILRLDYAPLVATARRVLVFWDAHGFDIAECVLGEILPLVAHKEHLVVMHDLTDARYCGPYFRHYGERGLWKGANDWSGPQLCLGPVNSCVEQAVAIVDFTSRNDLTLHSADESIRAEIGGDPGRCTVMAEVLGEDFFSLYAHWFYFSLNERAEPATFTFPRYQWAKSWEAGLA